MRKLKVLVVENQNNYIESLEKIFSGLSSIIDLEQLKIAKTVNAARELILANNKFDISILDYHMDQSKNSLELLKETKSHESNFGQLVFTTIDEKELEVFFRYRPASNYTILEKPFAESEVVKILGDVIKKLEFTKPEKLKCVLNLGISGEKIIYDFNTILFIEGAGKYCHYYTMENGNIIKTENVTGTLEEQSALLNDCEVFLRVHKSYIVNTSKIIHAKKDKGTTGWLSFINAEYNEKTNPYVGRYSIEHDNYQELMKRTEFSKI